MSTQARRSRSDAVTLGAALLLLLLAGAGFWLWGQRAREERQAVLAGVPEFPAPGQEARRRPAPRPAPVPAPARPPPPLPAAPRPKAPDRFNAFALAPAGSVAVLQVNALLNTPLFARFKECAPDGFRQLEAAAARLGLDLERDLDRVAMVPGGLAVSGFFGGQPIAEQLAQQSAGDGAGPTQRSYRDQTLWTTPHGTCVSQLGTTLVMGPADNCEALVDRALGEAPPAEAASELYGDLYARTDLAVLRDRIPSQLGEGERQIYGSLVESLDKLTVRANVWEQVAVSVDGEPQKGASADELARVARAAVSVVQAQIGEGDSRLQALAGLAEVKSEGGKLKIDLALPADDLFDRLHLPCAARDGGR